MWERSKSQDQHAQLGDDKNAQLERDFLGRTAFPATPEILKKLTKYLGLVEHR